MERESLNALEMLFELTKETAAMSAHIKEIKQDLKEHMKRTAQVEAEMKYLHRQVNLAHGAIAVLVFLAGLIKLVF